MNLRLNANASATYAVREICKRHHGWQLIDEQGQRSLYGSDLMFRVLVAPHRIEQLVLQDVEMRIARGGRADFLDYVFEQIDALVARLAGEDTAARQQWSPYPWGAA